jgi:uncharacterized membrane protein YqjE
MVSTERSVSEVLQDIFGNLQDIVRSEVRLAKTELREEVTQAREAAALLAVGGLCVLFALLAVMFALSRIMPNWGAALIVAVGLGIGCALMLGAGAKQLKRIKLVPKTRVSIEENIDGRNDRADRVRN